MNCQLVIPISLDQSSLNFYDNMYTGYIFQILHVMIFLIILNIYVITLYVSYVKNICYKRYIKRTTFTRSAICASNSFVVSPLLFSSL